MVQHCMRGIDQGADAGASGRAAVAFQAIDGADHLGSLARARQDDGQAGFSNSQFVAEVGGVFPGADEESCVNRAEAGGGIVSCSGGGEAGDAGDGVCAGGVAWKAAAENAARG